VIFEKLLRAKSTGLHLIILAGKLAFFQQQLKIILRKF